MTKETMIATITIPAPAEAVFRVLADPTAHAAIDGTGWVTESVDSVRRDLIDPEFLDVRRAHPSGHAFFGTRDCASAAGSIGATVTGPRRWRARYQTARSVRRCYRAALGTGPQSVISAAARRIAS
jgi:hypothetical protein